MTTSTLGAVLTDIRDGRYRQHLAHVRRIKHIRDEDAYREAKSSLPAATCGGTFAPTRRKANLVQHSGVVHGDLDHLTDARATQRALSTDAHVAYCFVSPGGDGLKLGVRMEAVRDDASYKHAWQAVADYCHMQYGMPWDPSGKDVSRLCFVSHDPARYWNPQAAVFPVPAPTLPPSTLPLSPVPWRPVSSDRRTRTAQHALHVATRLIADSTPGNRHQARTKAAYLLGGYVAGGVLSPEEALTALETVVREHTAYFPASMQTIRECFVAGQARPITLADGEVSRQTWLAVHWHTRTRRAVAMLRTASAEEVPSWRKC